jgi:DNA repair exonuclease SbcCD ATPase subunit
MNILHAIGLKGVGPFKELKFTIPLGVSAIYGLNRASGRASKNSNGVGKSFMLSVIPEIAYDEPIVGEKSDLVKTGVRAMSFTNYQGKKVLVRRKAVGKTDKIGITVDGVDQELRKLPVARAAIKALWPLTIDDYSTYVHIDSRIPHPLVMGTSADRKRFFTNFFNLHKLDAERKLYSAELTRLSKIRAAFTELRDQYLKGKSDLLTAPDLLDLDGRIATNRKILKTLQNRFAAVQDTIRLVQFGTSAGAQIKVLARACGGTITVEEFARARKDNAWELDKIEKDLEDAEAWDQYQRDNKHYVEAFNGLSDEAKAEIETHGLKVARTNAAEAARVLVRVRESIKRIKADIEGIGQDMPDLPPKVAAPEEDEDGLRTLKNVYEHHLEHASRFEDGKCETCGQPVQIKDPKVVQKKLDTVIAKLKAHANAKAYTTAKKERTRLEFKAKSYETQLGRERDKLKLCAREAALADELRDLPRKPKAFEGKKLQTVVLKRMLTELHERRSLLDYLEPHLDTVIEFKALTQKDLERVKDSEGLSDRMNAIQEKLSNLQAKREVHSTISGRLADMRTRLREMKIQLEDEQALKHLVQGYADKNIKKMAVEAISVRLMSLVNKYAKIIMPEDFRFEFRWDTQVSLIVHRKNGTKNESSDVRKLSGAESTLFTLILVCSLLNFVPPRKRCSVIILDEPTARLSDEMTEVFKKMVGILNTIIPSVVIITPKSNEVYEGAHNFTIIKERGVARIVPGMPHEVTT